MFVHEIVDGISATIIGVLIVICLTRTLIFIIKTLKQRASQKSRYELYSRMIDKFGTAPEFIAYLQSENEAGGGLQALEENAIESVSSAPMQKILFSIQIGVVAALVGSGLLALGNIFDRSLGGDLYIALTIAGTIGLMIGTGFLISTLISYKLSKKWGLLTVKNEKETESSGKISGSTKMSKAAGEFSE